MRQILPLSWKTWWNESGILCHLSETIRLTSFPHNLYFPVRWNCTEVFTRGCQTYMWLGYGTDCSMGGLFIYLPNGHFFFSHLLWQQDKCQALSTTCKWWVLMRQSSLFAPQRNLLIGWAKYQVRGSGTDSQRTIFVCVCTIYSSRCHLECIPGCWPIWPNPPVQHFNCAFIKSSRNTCCALNPSISSLLLGKIRGGGGRKENGYDDCEHYPLNV